MTTDLAEVTTALTRAFHGIAKPSELLDAIAAISRIEAGGVEGWKLVPIKPTDKMLHAMYWANGATMNTSCSAVYAAMLAAAPDWCALKEQPDDT